MKSQIIILFVVCCMLTACDRRTGNSVVATSDSANSQAWQNYNQQVKQQQETYAQQAKFAEQQLQAQAEMNKRADAQLQVHEDMQKRAEDLYKRMEALLTSQEQVTKRQGRTLPGSKKFLGLGKDSKLNIRSI